MEHFLRKKQSLKGRMLLRRDKLRPTLSAESAENHLQEWNRLQQSLEEVFEDIFKTCAEEHVEQFTIELEDLLDQHRAFRFEIQKLLQPTTPPEPPATAQSTIGTCDIRPPQIDLPRFNGDIEKWPTFSSLFTETIATIPNITGAIKFRMLESCLGDDPKSIVSFLPRTAAGFDHAWNLLQTRYENIKDVAYKLVERVLNLPVANTASQLQAMVDTIREVLRALEAMGYAVPPGSGALDVWLNPIVHTKLDYETYLQWEKGQEDDKVPPIEDLLSFLQKIAKTRLRSATMMAKPTTSKGKPTSNKPNCPNCQLEHVLYRCPSYSKSSVAERWATVNRLKVCINCLLPSHAGNNGACTTGTCRVCGQSHHSTLHKEQSATGKTIASTSRVSAVLLATALVHVGHNKKLPPLRALIDTGSQASLVTKRAARRLKLKSRPEVTPIVTACGSITSSARAAKCRLQSVHSEFSLDTSLIIVQTIAADQPSQKVNKEQLGPLIKGKTLADPDLHIPGPVDLLLGADIFARILKGGIVSSGNGQLVAIDTHLGCIVLGSLSLPMPQKRKVVANLVIPQLARFWEVEDGPPTRFLTAEEARVEKFIERTTQRSPCGRFVMRLPLKADPPKLGATRHIALTRLTALERRFKRDANYETAYKKVMQEYFDLGHLEPVPENEIPSRTYYLPHHAVTKEDSTSTKLRIVFDASTRSSNGISLNDCQENGPTLQDNLFTLMVRFRSYPVAITADISKMYRQIQLHPDDRDLQRILWRSVDTEPVEDYRLTTVTFGEKAAPYLATKALQLLADSSLEPRVRQVLKQDMYVDDLLSGANCPSAVASLQKALESTLHSAGFMTHKWASNEPTAIQHLHPERCAKAPNVTFSSPDDSLKTLGITWNTKQDYLSVRIPAPQGSKWSRRSVLSATNSVYDPLGWLSPVTVTAKLIMQSIVQDTLDWDAPLPLSQVIQWQEWIKDIPLLQNATIPRCLSPFASSVVLCGFADASERAYGAIVYAKSTDSAGNTLVRLVAAKTRVAPLKPVTLPRLELLAAVILCRLMDVITKALHNKPVEVRAWTDSTITLAWIQAHPSRWQTFVANRVAEIQSIVPSDNWNHVKSDENPADLATRGISSEELLGSSLWWNGPEWLTTSLDSGSLATPSHVPEERQKPITIAAFTIEEHLSTLLNRFSHYAKLRRVVAFMYLFVSRLRQQCGPNLGTSHFLAADVAIARWTQKQAFPDEIAALKSKSPVSQKSPLASLNPFLDDTGCLRVGGRLRNAVIPDNSKHPIIMPGRHHVTNLLIHDCHIHNLHSGPTLTQSILRHKYWIIHAAKTIKHVLHKCVRCTRCRAALAQQMMADLPAPRVTPVTRPFLRTGVDYAGPCHLKTQLARSTRTYKAYIAIFVCFATRAIHLELVTALTTPAFLAAFTRFTSRRGTPSDIYSDCGTNFVGAERELAEVAEHSDLQETLASRGLRWHFNPPAAPHFGGLWEAGVRSVKTHLRKVVGTTLLTYEEYYTFLCRAEAALNSRPLTPMSSDVNDLQALTPAHFVTMGELQSPLEEDLRTGKITTLKRWQLVQRLSQDLWARWSSEYLSRLTQRPKWWRKAPNLTVGTMVLIHDPNRPPLEWRLGRITEVHPGSDELVRVATVHTAFGDFQRPIHKLCPLPLDTDVQPLDNASPQAAPAPSHN